LLAGPKRVGQLARALPARRPLFLQAPLDDFRQRTRHLRSGLGERLVWRGNVLRGDRTEAGTVERDVAGQHRVGEHAERVDVAAAVEVDLACGLLGGHVLRRAERATHFVRRRVGRADERDTEVGEQRAVGAALDQNVLGLEVAMHDPFAMRVLEYLRELDEHPARNVRVEPPLAPQPHAERLAVHVAHDEVDEIGRLAVRVHRDGVRMCEPRRDACLATEALAMLLGMREFVTQNLDRNEPVQRDVACEENDTHPAAPELAHDLIFLAELRLQHLALDVTGRVE
jgi:hypothetical protein